MVTFVGKQANFGCALQQITELEHAAVEAYITATQMLKSTAYKRRLKMFQHDHKRQIEDLSNLLYQNNLEVPQNPYNAKELFAKGKVLLATLISDETILRALESSETDIDTAYKRLSIRAD